MSTQNKNDDFLTDYIRSSAKLAAKYTEYLQKSLENTEEAQKLYPSSKFQEVLSDIFTKSLEDPEKLYKNQIEFYGEYLKVLNNAWNKYVGDSETEMFKANPKDKRFKDEAWNNDFIFNFIKQSYLLTSNWLNKTVDEIEGVDKKTKEKYEFYTKQFIDAISPSNFAFTNPEVIKETISTNGENLTKGLQNLLSDMEKSKNLFNVSTADEHYFKLGENIARTPGQVVYKNDLMELIQYSPTTKTTYEKPLLIIPAWINKYYILDLSENNSMVKWLVDQGYTVFMISWVNPDKSLAHKKFEDYMLQGPLAALDAIEKATGSKDITAMGYCLGGTLLSCTMAYMKTKKDIRIKAATLLTTMVDFGDVGDMSVFIDEKQLDELDKQMKENGFIGGDEISAMFSALRSNDLIWSFVVNNYLLGKQPVPFDILYWNQDGTRMPADTHSFYLRNMYLKNLLKKPGGIALGGVKIDVTKIDTPTYMLSAKEDHIAPWKTTYETMNLFSGEKTFVLAGSGHVAGVINPPYKKKYGYMTNNKNEKSAAKWLSGASENEGSWWEHWSRWNSKYSGKKILASKPGSGKLKAICPAPGEYVKVK